MESKREIEKVINKKEKNGPKRQPSFDSITDETNTNGNMRRPQKTTGRILLALRVNQ